MSADDPQRLINMERNQTAGIMPVETAYGLLQGHVLRASPALLAMTAPWGSAMDWWRLFAAHITPPPPTLCPICQTGQRIGVVLASLFEPTRTTPQGGTPPGIRRTFEVTYSGHPHILQETRPPDTVDHPLVQTDMLLIRDRTQDQQHDETIGQTIRQYESICHFIQDVYYQIDLEGNILFISPSCYKLLLYHPEELLGTPFAALATTPDAFQELLDILKTVRVVHDFHLSLLCKKGNPVPVVLTAKRVSHNAGQSITIEGIVRDVSDRERLDTLLEERTQVYRQATAQWEQLKAAIDQHVLISIVDPEGNILSVNDRFLEVSRYAREEVVGKNPRLLDSGYHPKSYFKEMWRTILSGSVWRGEMRNRKKNDDLFWIDCSIIPCLTPLGHPFQYICIATEISEWVRARLRLERNRDFLHRVIHAMGEGVMVMDLQGHLLSLNQEGERLLGWREAELIHKNVHEAIHSKRPDGSPLAAEECLVHQSLLGRIFRVENDHYLQKDGSFLPVAHVTAPLHDDNGIIGSVAIFHDNTRARKRLQELEHTRDVALESARLKSQFLANMSHEIRTPMNAIIGMNDLLMDTPLNEEQEEFTEIIRDSAKSLLSLINDILDFSKIEAGKMDIEEIEFSPVTVVEGCAGLLAAQAHEKGLSLMTFISPQVPRILKGDPGRLRQMVLNLASNAIKFTEEGEVVIRVQAKPHGSPETGTDERVVVRFSVTDTGIGLSDEIKERLFEPFTQADRTTSRKHGGTGLGLAISKRLTELMGGSIGTETEHDKGTTFWFHIPFRHAQPMSPAEDEVDPTFLQGLRVLTLLANPTDQEILGSYFRAWGLIHQSHLLRGKKNQAAWQEVVHASPPFALVVMALSSSDMHDPSLFPTGETPPAPDATPSRPSLPVNGVTHWIALLDSEDKPLREFALAAGFAACLVKPVRQEEWLHHLAHLLTPAKGDEAPALPAHWSPDLPSPPHPDAYDALESGKLLLLVEDNAVNQKVTLLQLKKLGYAVHAVSNGREAVEAVANLPYALVLMDCQMPVMDGFEATHAIRKTEQTSLRHIPIVAMTANAMKGDRERCLRAGMDDYLSKPVAPEILLQKLQYWIPKGSNELPAIEIQQLRQLFGEDDAMVRELLQHFPASARELLDRLWQGIQAKDKPILNDTAFELQEACANMGATGMSATAHTLERAIAKEDWDRSRLAMEQLERIFQKVEMYVRNYDSLHP
ncbi:MAG: PAS domain S-box protein [Magnetococcales bacterium]|nr:PAS domain S-box protein [Magnetococcales bacterium]